LKLSQTRFQSAFSPTSNFGRENSEDLNTALQSERGFKEATARETKFDSKRDKEEEEEEEEEETGDYIFACKLHFLHYQLLEVLEAHEIALLCFESWHLLLFCSFSDISALLFGTTFCFFFSL
jgi:hypothetical protein